MLHDQLKFVNRREHIQMAGSRIPHWNQCDCVQFVTFRLADSLPQSKLQEYMSRKAEWLNAHPKPWSLSDQDEYDNVFGAAIDKWIDAGHGECLLKDQQARDALEDVMMLSDGQRYDIYAFVIMPNHVHVLMAPMAGNAVQDIVRAWKSASSHRINKLLNRKGTVWERDSFDHMVRNAEDFNAKLQYIADNPRGMSLDWFTLRKMLE